MTDGFGEIARRYHVGITSVLRRCGVGALAWAALGAAAMPAHAGPWEAFVARCLIPMENLAAGDADGLEPYRGSPAAEHVAGLLDARVAAFILPDDDGVLHLSPGECRVSADPVPPDAGAAARAWEARNVRPGRYERDEAGTLLSDRWREPRLAVHIFIDDTRGAALFTAQETDLES